jgi:predicted DNA repair protein MutK
VATDTLPIQLGVLVAIGLIATFAVYGIVGMIIKMDDVGFYLQAQSSKTYNKIGSLLVKGMPKVLKTLGWIGMIAMLMVGGGIIIHNVEFLHFLSYVGQGLPYILPVLMEFFISPVSVALILGAIIVLVGKIYQSLLPG